MNIVYTTNDGFVPQVATSMCSVYENNLEEISDPQDFGWLNEETERYLSEHMLAGRILQRTLINDLADGYYYQYGNYACLELVGQVRSEESLNSDGKRD